MNNFNIERLIVQAKGIVAFIIVSIIALVVAWNIIKAGVRTLDEQTSPDPDQSSRPAVVQML